MAKTAKSEKKQGNVNGVNYRWSIDFHEDLGGKIKILAAKRHVSETAYILWKMGEIVDAETRSEGLK